MSSSAASGTPGFVQGRAVGREVKTDMAVNVNMLALMTQEIQSQWPVDIVTHIVLMLSAQLRKYK
jgi:hypothetical protein